MYIYYYVVYIVIINNCVYILDVYTNNTYGYIYNVIYKYICICTFHELSQGPWFIRDLVVIDNNKPNRLCKFTIS